MKKLNQQLIIGNFYNGYGKYLGITKVYKNSENIFEEHRFQTNKHFQGVFLINRINTKDKKTIEKILLNK